MLVNWVLKIAIAISFGMTSAAFGQGTIQLRPSEAPPVKEKVPVKAPEKSNPVSTSSSSSPAPTSLEKSADAWLVKNLDIAKRQYRQGEINARQYWARLYKMREKTAGILREGHSMLFQAQAHLLAEQKLYMMASRFATLAILLEPDPFVQRIAPSWHLLYEQSKKQNIRELLTKLATRTRDLPQQPPEFGRDWFFYIAESYVSKEDQPKAIANYAKLRLTDRMYFPGAYQLAMALVEQNKLDPALKVLTELTEKENIAENLLPKFRQKQLYNFARLAMGRILYEKKDYVESVKEYRKVYADSPLYYSSLFEQSWALFMGGYPNHALGILYAVDSPFFENNFNPEVPVLRSLVYYWLCRYEDSRSALADFIEFYERPVKDLGGFLEKKNLNPKSSYDLFENLLSGVSSESLGIKRELLASVAKTDRMNLVRDQLASVMAERARFERYRGFDQTNQAKDYVLFMIDDWIEDIKMDLGKVYIEELQSLEMAFKDLRYQADFLYIELLMSEKEQLLGRELHAESKMEDSSDKKIQGWGRNIQAWDGSKKEEFWWDEMGFHIFNVESKCNATEKTSEKSDEKKPS